MLKQHQIRPLKFDSLARLLPKDVEWSVRLYTDSACPLSRHGSIGYPRTDYGGGSLSEESSG